MPAVPVLPRHPNGCEVAWVWTFNGMHCRNTHIYICVLAEGGGGWTLYVDVVTQHSNIALIWMAPVGGVAVN